MHTLVLSDFTAYTYTDLYVHLMKLNETSFCIQLPRYNTEGNFDEDCLPGEYGNAVFIGERLSVFSNDFCYTVPLTKSRQPFTYEFATSNTELLAETLYFVLGSYEGRVSSERFDKYLDELHLFWSSNSQDKKVPVCYGLFYIMMETMETL